MTASPAEPAWTDSGIPAESDKRSLTVGPDPPVLLQDHYSIEQMTQRNRERGPERQRHGTGSGASGYSEATDDASAKVVVFQPGTRTDANGESRSALAQLAEEQAALKRVAILVARGTPSEQVFAAVTEEVGRLLSVDMTNMCRYEPDNTMTFVVTWAKGYEGFRPGSRWPLGGQNLATLVFETGRSVRIDNYADASGPLSVAAQDAGIRSAVASPIIVEGRLWGMMGAGSSIEQTLPRDSEARLASFTELVAMAIANAESRAELKASRARVITATDEARRRIERDLHDGIQQQLVSLLLELRSAEATVPAELEELRAHQARMKRGLVSVLTELREISRGIHPAILTEAGLGSALKTLARRSALPVELELRYQRRLPEHVEVAAYYVVSEALANAAKHAHASVVKIDVAEQGAILKLAIRDDGVGGADPGQGTGLAGLADRIEALGGRLEIISPARSGTWLSIEIPVEGHSATTLAGEEEAHAVGGAGGSVARHCGEHPGRLPASGNPRYRRP
jgi:signal transduction histidine kinase